MEKQWRGLPYFTIADHYRNLFGTKVYKIPVTIADTCPNREGLKGMETCIFCNEWGSAARSDSHTMELNEQIEKYKKDISQKYKAQQFLVYFQAYTNSFLKIQKLRENFDAALAHEHVKGFVLGTRPDCLSLALLNLWNEYQEKTFVGIELGIQSFFDKDLLFLKRGHTTLDSLRAIERISRDTKCDLGIHLIFGLPDETDEQIVKSAEICNDLPITNIKLHNLHVLKKTGLEQLYQSKAFTPIAREEYTRRVGIFLAHLSPRFFLHRLAALAPRWDELIAPAWTADKMGTHQFIVDYLRNNKIYQSKSFTASTPELGASQERHRIFCEPVEFFSKP